MKLAPRAIQALAAEYVLGTLRGRARARFEEMRRADREVAENVRLWEDALTPLSDGITPIEPPARVWRAIEARLGPRTATRRGVFSWRSFAIAAGGLATVLLAFFLWIAPAARDEPMFVAVLTAPDTVPRMVVSMHEPDLLRVRVVKPWAGMVNQDLELWVMPREGKPRSLGLVYNAMGDTMLRVGPSDPRVQGAHMLAITMEPRGGSPTGQPTGAPVCSGAIAPMKRA